VRFYGTQTKKEVKYMKRKLLIGLLVLALLAVPAFAIACEEEPTEPTEPTQPTEPTEPTEPAWEWPRSLVISTFGLGTWGYALTVAWGTVMEEETGMRVRALPEDNTQVRDRWLREGTTDLTNLSDPIVAPIMGAEGKEAVRDLGPYPFRWVWIMQASNNGFFVRGDSDIETIYDITPETKIAEWSNPGPIAATSGLLAWIQLDREDANITPVASYAETIRGVVDGRYDLTYAAASSSVTYEAEANPYGLRWLALPAAEDPEGALRCKALYPAAGFGEMTTGVESAHGVNSFLVPFMYICSEDIETELIYNLAKWFDESFDAYKDMHEVAPCMSIDEQCWFLENTVLIPVHEGVIQYLEEVGRWTPTMEARHQANLVWQGKYIDAYQAAIAEADAQGIEVDPENSEWVDLWENYKKDLGLPLYGAFEY
jgi:TRAP transporter TAXI family solute receptor